ncbi:hypothetical protein [Ferrovibrio sp.]|uniref:hypothetical protein n=1 Tax=Ferrovibrio sp. TaxID=1917215 RepID=UPI002611A243|nr:hypothetical protein [Ferrovibrio sp.]
MHRILSRVLLVLGVLIAGIAAWLGLGSGPAQAQEATATFAGRQWNETAVVELMAVYAENDRNYRNSIVKPGWAVIDCNATPYKAVTGETRYCFDGPIYQVNQGCQVKQFMLAIISATEEILVMGNYPTESRCGMFAASAKRDASYILFPVKIIRPVDETGDPGLVGDAHALSFSSDGRPCFGYRDYGTPSFGSNVYAYTSTGHVCRKAPGATYGRDDMKRMIEAFRPVLSW